MSLFFSSETSGRAYKALWFFLKPIDNALKDIRVSDYTKDIDEIGIIVNCFNDCDLEAGFGKPRKYISYKKRFADIRLNIPYVEFLAADKQKQFEMVKQNIFDSIKVVDERLNKKKECSFDGQKMIADIEEKIKELKF